MEIRELLLRSQTQIEEAVQKAELIPVYQRNLDATREQIAAVAKEKAKDIIVLLCSGRLNRAAGASGRFLSMSRRWSEARSETIYEAG